MQCLHTGTRLGTIAIYSSILDINLFNAFPGIGDVDVYLWMRTCKYIHMIVLAFFCIVSSMSCMSLLVEQSHSSLKVTPKHQGHGTVWKEGLKTWKKRPK